VGDDDSGKGILSRTVDQHIEHKNKEKDKEERENNVAEHRIPVEGGDFPDGGLHLHGFLDVG
jgi:hypothetical protein